MDDLYTEMADAVAAGRNHNDVEALLEVKRALGIVPLEWLEAVVRERRQDMSLTAQGYLDARAYVEQGRPRDYFTPIPVGTMLKVTGSKSPSWKIGEVFRMVWGGGYVLHVCPQADDLPHEATLDLTVDSVVIISLPNSTADEGVPADDDDGPGWKPSTEYAAKPHITDRTPNYIRVAHGYPPITGGMDFSIVRDHAKVVKAKGDKFRRGKLAQEQQAREGRLDPTTQIVDTAVKPKPTNRVSTIKVVKK